MRSFTIDEAVAVCYVIHAAKIGKEGLGLGGAAGPSRIFTFPSLYVREAGVNHADKLCAYGCAVDGDSCLKAGVINRADFDEVLFEEDGEEATACVLM